MTKRAKITVIGAGNVGATAARIAARKGLGDVVLVDIVEGLPQGKALDMNESLPVEGAGVSVVGTNGYAETAGSDVVVITSGIARKPGMSRDDLLATNARIVRSVAVEAAKASPGAVLVVVSNPLDAMCHAAFEASGFPRERVVGMAGILDTARFRSFVADALGVSAKDVTALVLGGHGDTMVPLSRLAAAGGVPLSALLPKEKMDAIVKRTREGGAEVVALLKTGSAYYAPAAAAIEMAESIIRDQKRVLPCAALLDGEYGIRGLFIGVPVVLGARGVERVIEVALSEAEKAELQKSAAAVRTLVDAMAKLPR
ncbi:MAG: malate dehydrogenase [Planctomycetota bacterium]